MHSVRAIRAGAVAVVLAVAVYGSFELDRFLVPKELVLHATALVAALLGVRALRRIELTWIDWLLLAYLALSVISLLTATNRWAGVRAVALSASALLIFWLARGRKEIVSAVALAVVLASITSLLQAYGVETLLFAESRAPGGTLGNRNFVGHLAAFGLPAVILTAWRGARAAWLGIAIVAAALVLTRSRAAWIAAAVVLLIVLLRRDKKVLPVLACAAAGILAALLIPNALRWRSDNPYLESVTGIARYDEGSGRGRLVQYEQSLRMAAANPILGVGPGNWPVVYPRHAARRDPSLDPNADGMTYNPWPSSDWIAFIAERGFLAALLLGIAFLGIAIKPTGDADEKIALLATLAGAGVAGAFDAVLLLALPALLVFATIGALWTPSGGRASWIALLLIAVSAIGAARSAAQLYAMHVYDMRDDRAVLERASRIDPGNYKLHLRLARSGKRASRCEHALAARALFPSSEAARAVARGCGGG